MLWSRVFVQHMSELERERRRKTGTLSNDTMIGMALDMLSSGGAAAAQFKRRIVSDFTS